MGRTMKAWMINPTETVTMNMAKAANSLAGSLMFTMRSANKKQIPIGANL